MGCISSKSYDDNVDEQGAAQSRLIAQQLEAENKEENEIIKMLVLGTGESGKSTVFKQMKILYSIPDPPSKFIMVCRANLFGNVHLVAGGMEKLSIAYGSPEAEGAWAALQKMPTDGTAEGSPEILKHFEILWADSGVKEAIARASEYQLNDSTEYFWQRASHILESSYMPTEQDILRARVRTTGIVQQNFAIGDKRYTMFDVGGQRNERRKWIHCFDLVTCIIFVTAISEYDQVLYEDETTNRMDEALTLFDQILNHPSFSQTSMILFLNKRDLFEKKLKTKDMTCWQQAAASVGQDYDKCIQYIKDGFMEKNRNPDQRQVYVHATCATDTKNIEFVMTSVFDIILKHNLRKMGDVDVEAMIGTAGTGKSSVVYPPTWGKDTLVLCACHFTNSLQERNVLIAAANKPSLLPAVEVSKGKPTDDEFKWVMEQGKLVPQYKVSKSEIGSFQGNFKEAANKLREILGGPAVIGTIYDQLIQQKNGPTLLVCYYEHASSVPMPAPFQWVVHETFMNAHYKEFEGIDTDANPCKPPGGNEEFDPFAPNPVGFNWMKGLTLYSREVSKSPDKGVYLGVFKVCSTPSGFKIMVNEHKRTNIPLIFISESQLGGDDYKKLQGVRVRESRGIDLLEGGKPNFGWLGPEMSGEDGATVMQKMDWAIREGKERLGVKPKEPLGFLYDYEAINMDENDKIQLVLFASIAKDSTDLLPGHIWVDRKLFEIQNMKFNCPTLLQGILGAQMDLINKLTSLNTGDSLDAASVEKMRREKDSLKASIADVAQKQIPLKWVDRVIVWVADKCPSFAEGIKGAADMGTDELIDAAIANNTATIKNAAARQELIRTYKAQ